MPLAGVYLVFQTGIGFRQAGPDVQQQLQQVVYVIVFLTSVLIPLLTLPALFHFGIIKSVQMSNAKERVLPLFITAILLFWCFYLLRLFPVRIPSVMKQYLLSSAIVVLLLGFISLKLKVSAHAAGMGGLLGLSVVLGLLRLPNSLLWLPIVCVLTGLVLSARLKLGAHNSLQVYLGLAIGFVFIYVPVMYY